MVNKYLLYGRCIVFVVLVLFQGFLFINFLRKYHKSEGWYAIILLFLPTCVMWAWRESDLTRRLRWLLHAWLVHVVIGLVPTIAIIFGLIENKLQKGEPYGPDSLKLTMLISPLLLLVLLNNPRPELATGEYRVLMTNLSYKITIDLFDGVDLLGANLEENELSHGIPVSYETAIIASSCLGFLLSPLELFGYKVDEEGHVKGSKALAVFQIAIQVCINALFLGLRVGIYLQYGADASIFIAKNVLLILVALFKLIPFIKCCEKEHEVEV